MSVRIQSKLTQEKHTKSKFLPDRCVLTPPFHKFFQTFESALLRARQGDEVNRCLENLLAARITETPKTLDRVVHGALQRCIRYIFAVRSHQSSEESLLQCWDLEIERCEHLGTNSSTRVEMQQFIQGILHTPHGLHPALGSLQLCQMCLVNKWGTLVRVLPSKTTTQAQTTCTRAALSSSACGSM